MDVLGVSGVWKCGSVVYIWLVKRTYTGTEKMPCGSEAGWMESPPFNLVQGHHIRRGSRTFLPLSLKYRHFPASSTGKGGWVTIPSSPLTVPAPRHDTLPTWQVGPFQHPVGEPERFGGAAVSVEGGGDEPAGGRECI